MEDIKVVPKNCFEVYREKENGINAVVAPPPPRISIERQLSGTYI